MVSFFGSQIKLIQPRFDILGVIILLITSFLLNFASFFTYDNTRIGPLHPEFECEKEPTFVQNILKFSTNSKWIMIVDAVSMTIVFLTMVVLLVSAKSIETRLIYFPQYKKFLSVRAILLILKFVTNWIVLGHPFPLCTYWFQMPCEYLPWTNEVIDLAMRGNFLFLADVVITGVTYFGMKRLMNREASDTVARHFESLRLQSITACSTLPHPNSMNPRHSPCQHEIYDEVNEDHTGYTLTRKKMAKIGQTVSYKKGSESVTFHNYENSGESSCGGNKTSSTISGQLVCKENDYVCLAD